jgi:ATP-dependent DNA helicase RecG
MKAAESSTRVAEGARPRAGAAFSPSGARPEASDPGLDLPIQFLPGVGPRRAELLARLGIRTPRELLWNLPRTYEDRRELTRIRDLVPGQRAQVLGRVVAASVRRRPGRRPDGVVRIEDETGALELVFWGQPFRVRDVAPGAHVLVYGEVASAFRRGRGGASRNWIMSSPDLTRVAAGQSPELGLLAVYPLTEGLGPGLMRALVAAALPSVAAVEILPPEIAPPLDLPPLAAAIDSIHRPASLAAAERGRRRLAFDEFLTLLLVMERRRRGRCDRAPVLAPGARYRLVLAGLPFPLTAAQRRTRDEILADLARPTPMHRLLEGDVGSGKTVVALLAVMAALDSGQQAAIMAPTEILAMQHARTALRLLPGVSPIVFTGSITARERRQHLAALARGDGELVIGTHALFGSGVRFRRLGLVVVDEQHRFGVRERRALAGKGNAPHVLVMTATPIPRSLALTVFGDLDLSLVDELPPGRALARTHVVESGRRERLLAFLGERIAAGGQVLYVTPRIDADPSGEVAAASERAAELGQHAAFAGIRIGLLHGRLKAGEKEAVMARFRSGEVPLLVATSVVEVGIDVAAVNVIVIEHPERFGLSQLHQLRGRAGRGSELAHAVLLIEPDLDPITRTRLETFARTGDGFAVSELDLAARGPGALLGLDQHGFAGFRFADPIGDRDLVAAAQPFARELVAADPELRRSPALAQGVERLEAELASHAEAAGTGE